MMALHDQRFPVISRTPNSNEEICSSALPQPSSVLMRESPKVWVESSTRRPSHLPKHIIVLETESSVKYKCTVCAATFKSKSNCFYHKHCGDDSEKPFTCSMCGRKFSTRTHFSYHILTHSGASPFKCRECGKAFKTKNKLRRHEQMHTKMPKQFFCDICGRAFLRKSSIQIHKRIHTGEKPYQCNECSRAFREKKNLVLHLSHHMGIKNWICEICGKSYSMKWDLELHKQTHSRTRPFRCDVDKCQQTFSQKRYLKRHMGSHKNLIKFVCSICEKEFSRRDNLQRHIVNTHLESQNVNPSKVEKTKQLLDTMPYIRTMKIPEELKDTDDIAPCDEKKSVVRTESVIISKTKARDVIGSCSTIEDPHNRVSVIRTIGDVDHMRCGKYPQLNDDVFENCSIENRNDINELHRSNNQKLITYTERDDVFSEDEIQDNIYSHSYDCRVRDGTMFKVYSCEGNPGEILESRFCDEELNSTGNPISLRSSSVERENIKVVFSTNKPEEPVVRDNAAESIYLIHKENEEHRGKSFLLQLFDSETSEITRDQCSVACSDERLSEGIHYAQRTVAWQVPDDHSCTEEYVALEKSNCIANYDHRSVEEIFSISGDIFDGEQNSVLRSRKSVLCGGDYDQSVSHCQTFKKLDVNKFSHEQRPTHSINEELINSFPLDSSKRLQFNACSNMSNYISESVSVGDRASETEVTEVVSHFVPQFVPDEKFTVPHMKTRCMLPKKVIAASFRDLSVIDVKNKSTKAVDIAVRDNYKLLDLSMKGQ